MKGFSKKDVMAQRVARFILWFAAFCAGIFVIACLVLGASKGSKIEGIVIDDEGPVEGATVRIQATTNETLTDSGGRFALDVSDATGPVTVSAWNDLYYCAKVEGVVPPVEGIVLRLISYQTSDNPDFEWTPPIQLVPDGPSCTRCKPGVTEIWLENAHAGSAVNPRYLSMYNGTDLLGNQSPQTRYGFSRDYGTFQIPPVVDETYFGPGYKLDFPDTAGNCAACHNPGAAVDAPYGVDPNSVSGADSFGVHCDYCHKVAAVILDPETNRPYANMPGVLSSDVRRPFPEDPDRYELFFGPFDDDNVPEEDTRLPLIEESAFCAPCHSGVFWDTLIYNSYGEWLDSEYSDPETGKTCQACHMPAPSIVNGEIMTNVAPGNGGVERDPLTLRAHSQLGATDVDFLQNAVSMDVESSINDGILTIAVAITNDNTGHHIPTDSPLRHLILLVQATNEGALLAQLSGSTLPNWCGEGDSTTGCYAGLPGAAYAKVLEELWTGISPTGAYWNPTRIISDNRLAAFETDTSTYVFELPEEGAAEVRVVLLFRRAYKDLMDQKQWETPDIVVAEEVLQAKQ